MSILLVHRATAELNVLETLVDSDLDMAVCVPSAVVVLISVLVLMTMVLVVLVNRAIDNVELSIHSIH